MSLLRINQLQRNYSDFSLGPLNLEIQAGEVMGIVGANGAGKSTLFRLLMGLVRRHGGEVEIAGQPATNQTASWRELIGYVGDSTAFFDSWTGARNLQLLSRFYRNWSQELAEHMAARLELDLRRKVSSYSTGQRAKLAIVLALAHRPRLLFMDEAANGLDPVARETFIELLFEAMDSGDCALLYASHHVSEIESLIDRVVLLNKGHVLANALKEDLVEDWRKITFRSEKQLGDIPSTTSCHRDHPYVEIISSETDITLAWLAEQGIEDIQSSRLSLEKISVEILRNSTALKNSGQVTGGARTHV